MCQSLTLCNSEGAVRDRSPASGLPMVENGMAGGVGVGEAPSGGLGALSMGNWAHIRAARNTSNSCIVSRGEIGWEVTRSDLKECRNVLHKRFMYDCIYIHHTPPAYCFLSWIKGSGFH